MPADNDLYACYVAEIASPQYAFIYNPTNRKKTKTYGLEGLYTSLRQGRSLPLPTLPFQRTNRYAVVGAMPLVRTWVITDDLFSLADLLYLSHDGIDSPHASCMIIFELVCFFLHIIFSPFHLFTFRFPALPNAQPLGGS